MSDEPEREGPDRRPFAMQLVEFQQIGGMAAVLDWLVDQSPGLKEANGILLIITGKMGCSGLGMS